MFFYGGMFTSAIDVHLGAVSVRGWVGAPPAPGLRQLADVLHQQLGALARASLGRASLGRASLQGTGLGCKALGWRSLRWTLVWRALGWRALSWRALVWRALGRRALGWRALDWRALGWLLLQASSSERHTKWAPEALRSLRGEPEEALLLGQAGEEGEAPPPPARTLQHRRPEGGRP